MGTQSKTQSQVAAIGLSCAHCGLSVPAGRAAADGDESFCCSGCEVARGILRAGGLEQYYSLPVQRDRPVKSSDRNFLEFDHPAFEKLYITSSGAGLNQVELYLEDVHCASCVWLVERVPRLLNGVLRTELDFSNSMALVEWDPAQVELSAVAGTLDQLGYRPHPFRGVSRKEMRRQEDRAALIRIGVAGALAGNVMLPALALYAGDSSGMLPEYHRMFRWVSLLLTIPALLFPGRVFFAGAIASLRTRRLHMDLPIAIALSAAFVRGAINTITDTGPIYFDGVTALIFLLLIGRFLSQRGQRSATDAAESLFALTPNSATVVSGEGAHSEIPTAALTPGMKVWVQGGETIPADGTIVLGKSQINTAVLSGESKPISVATGDLVHAGTINLSAPLTVVVEAAGENSRLAGLMSMIAESARRKAPAVALADRMSGVFVAVVLLLAATTFAVWTSTQPMAAWDNAIALLIVTCPCALALATPLAFTAAIGRAAEAGILIKGGDALQHLSKPGDLVIDKTGTITEASFELVCWRDTTASADRSPSEVPTFVKNAVTSLEAGSAHPIAKSLTNAWPNAASVQAENVHGRLGGGVSGTVEGREVLVGSERWILQRLQHSGSELPRLDRADLTPVFVAVDGQIVGVLGLGDRVRVEAGRVLANLEEHGWRVHLLSGDNPIVVNTVGDRLGLRSDRVHGGVTPEGKLEFIESLSGSPLRNGPVVMVGDGVNDAAAIARADVGVSVHGSAEASLDSADVFFVEPGLRLLPLLLEGSEKTLTVVKRNIFWALGYNLIGVGLAMSGLLSPLVAAVLMPISSLTVLGISWLSATFTKSAGAIDIDTGDVSMRVAA